MPYRPATHRPRQSRPPDTRPGSAARGYGSKWQQYRAAYLANHPYCVECEQQGRVVLATVVDHKVPHRGDNETFWQDGNHQGLCAYHHNVKTARGE